MGEFNKRALKFETIVNQECDYSCWIGPRREEKPQKPNRTQCFVSLEIVEEAKKGFPEYPTPLPESQYSKDKWISMLDEWDSKVQKWFDKWFGGSE